MRDAEYEYWPAGATALMTVTLTQANAAGGAIKVNIVPGKGQEFEILGFRLANSGTNAIQASILNANSASSGVEIIRLCTIASGAGTVGFLGGTATGAQANAIPSGPWIVSGTMSLFLAQTGAGAQNDTFTANVMIRVKTSAMPLVDHANSTNPGNVTATAGAESFATV